MSKLNLLALMAVLLPAVFFAGYKYRKPEIVTEVEVREVAKIITKRIVEKEITAQGAVKETTTEVITENTKIQTKEEARVVIAAPAKPQWSIGLGVGMPNLEGSYVPSDIEVGRRMFGNLWGTAGYNTEAKSATLGIRLEF